MGFPNDTIFIYAMVEANASDAKIQATRHKGESNFHQLLWSVDGEGEFVTLNSVLEWRERDQRSR